MSNSIAKSDADHSTITMGSPVKTTIAKQPTYSGRSAANNNDQLEGYCCLKSLTPSKSLIDTVRITFPVCRTNSVELLKKRLKALLRQFHIRVSPQKATLRYFSDGILLVSSDGSKQCCGALKWARDRVQLELSGNGCNYFNVTPSRMLKLYEFALQHIGVIRRLDIAADDYSGKFNFRDTAKAYSRGRYNNKGPRPTKTKCELETGRSLIIGSRKSSQHMCIYEKGKAQELPLEHPNYNTWTRHELRFKGSTSFVIPLDTLVNPDAYFAGAYPANKRILKGVTPRNIKREVSRKLANNIAKSVNHLQHQWGKFVYQLTNALGDSEKVLAEISRPGCPNKFKFPQFVEHKEVWDIVASDICNQYAQGKSA